MTKDTIIKNIRARLSDLEKEQQNIFSTEEIECYLSISLGTINQILRPSHKVNLTLEKAMGFADLLTHGAVVAALGAKALVEAGREFRMVDSGDSGVDYDPPKVSQMIKGQWELEYQMYMKKLELMLNLPYFQQEHRLQEHRLQEHRLQEHRLQEHRLED